MSETGFNAILGAERPSGPIKADPDPKSVALPPDWKQSLDAALPKAQKKLDIENLEAAKSVNIGYMALGGLFIAISVYLIVYKWQRM